MPTTTTVSESHQTVPLDFHSIRTVLETHVWPPGDNDKVFRIPIVDFSGLSESSRKLIVEACKKWGVFQLTNHGIPSELLTKLWPDHHSRVFCNVIEDFQQRMTKLAAKLFRLILRSHNTSEQEIRLMSAPESIITSLQLNSYPPCPNPTQAMGLAPHTDTALISLVNQGSVKGQGLQIIGGNGEWGMVPPVPGALTVNVGDLLHIISNGRFHTVRHRVVIKEPMLQRVSVTLFYYPTPDFFCCWLGMAPARTKLR